MDISLLIMAAPHVDSPYLKGDIVSASLMHGEECTNPRFVLVNITGVPDKAPPSILLKRIKRMLEKENFVLEGNPPVPRRLRRRQWHLKPADLPVGARNTLLADRKITVTWTQAKPYLKRRFVVVEDDVSQDTETPITDDDV